MEKSLYQVFNVGFN